MAMRTILRPWRRMGEMVVIPTGMGEMVKDSFHLCEVYHLRI